MIFDDDALITLIEPSINEIGYNLCCLTLYDVINGEFKSRNDLKNLKVDNFFKNSFILKETCGKDFHQSQNETRYILNTYLNALVDFEKKLKQWIHEDEMFNVKFIGYIQKQNLPLSTIQRLSIESYFKSNNNLILENYIKSEKNIFENLIFAKIEKILKNNYKKLGEKHDEMINQLRNSKYSNVKDRFDRKTIFNENALLTLIQPSIRVIGYNICKETVNHAIVAKFNPRNKVNNLKQENFIDNSCILQELCGKRFDQTKTEIQISLKSYFETAIKLMDDDRYDNNKNIKDEIDESIYDVIQDLLTKDERVKKNAECITKYIIRKNAIDIFYSTDLLFNETKLKQKIEESVQEYENLFFKK